MGVEIAWKVGYSLKTKQTKNLWVHEQVKSDFQELGPQALKDFFNLHDCDIQAYALWALQTVTFSETVIGLSGRE